MYITNSTPVKKTPGSFIASQQLNKFSTVEYSFYSKQTIKSPDFHKMRLKHIFISCLMTFCINSYAQEYPMHEHKRIFFPHPMDAKWGTSIGITSTTMHRDITEEQHFRIPAIDFHVVRKISKKLYVDGRINSQILQNLITIGPRWSTKLTDRISMAVGNDVGFWFGNINTSTLNTKGNGIQNYPNIAFGYRFNKKILLSLKAESLMNLVINTYAGENKVNYEHSLFSGSAYTVALEQPFYGNKSITLGFRAIYTNFLWQTWTLFEDYDRNLFFPQIIAAVIL